MNRIYSVDFFRVIAIIFVIAIHTNPFAVNNSIDYSGNKYLYVFINQLARFAVPFFFIISGYFYGVKINKSDDSIESITKKMVLRIAIIWIFWNFIYLLPFSKLDSLQEYGILGIAKVFFGNIKDLIQHPKTLLFQGASIHLWFLSSMLFSILTTGFFLKYKLNNWLIFFAITLYVIGVFAKAYLYTPLGINLHFDSRDGLFFSLIFFSTGYKMAFRKPKNNWIKIGVPIFIFGFVFHFLEIYFLYKYYNTWPNQDYVFSTYFMGLGIAVISLSNHKIFNIPLLNYLGKKTLGIYAIHIVFINILKPVVIQIYHPLLEIGFPVMIYLISFGVIEVLSKNKILNKVVM